MSSPEELREVTEKTLHTLIADDSLKYRILQKAACSEQQAGFRQKRMIPVFCAVLAVLLIAVVSLNAIQAVPSSGPGELTSFTAGGIDPDPVSMLPEDFDPDTVSSVEMDPLGRIEDPVQCAALSRLLLDQSVPAGTEDPDPAGHLILTTVDAKEYAFDIRDPYLFGENGRCWSCPGFFKEFSNMIQ